MADKIAWQSIDVRFPQTLYAPSLWMGQNNRIPYFMEVTHTTLKSLLAKTRTNVSKLRETKGDDSVSDIIMFTRLEYESDYKLHKNLWIRSEFIMDGLDRNNRLIEAIAKPDLFYVCVGAFYSLGLEKKPEYINAFAFYKNQLPDLDLLMSASVAPVSPETKNAAVYTIAETYAYDLLEGKEIKKSDDRV